MEAQGATVEPFSSQRLLSGQWDVWHVHWPEHMVSFSNRYRFVWTLFKFWFKLQVASSKGTKIFWTVHNLRSHERRHPALQNLFWKAFLPRVTGIICMTEAGRTLLRAEHPSIKSTPTFIIPHGHYRGVYPDTVQMDQARQALGIGLEENVISFIGQIRVYKGVPHLIRSFNAAALTNSRLVIAGEPRDGSINREMYEAASGHENVMLRLNFIDPAEIQLYLRAADLIVLPYKEILNSGTALLALSFDRPILVPNRGALGELYEAMGPDWVRLYDGELTPRVLGDAIIWAKHRQAGTAGTPSLEALDWSRIATFTLRAFAS
jgi:glycosyltransferase involved in cell wall biosynthesis